METNKFDYELIGLSDDDVAQFGRYELTREDLAINQIKYCPERRSYVFPAYDVRRVKIGMLERTFKWQINRLPGARKATYHKLEDVSRMYVPLSATLGTSIAVVEDALSAIKVSKILPAVALLGTSMSIGFVRNLLARNIRDITVMLDPDATHIAITLKSRYEHLFNRMRCILLDNDPKDTHYETIATRIKS